MFGGNPASSIGSPSRHCYSGELQRPQPVPTPRQGARWRLGVSQGNTVQDTVSVTLKHPAEDGWEREAARRLGCYASSGSDADDGLVGERVPVRVDQILLYENPAKSYVGSLAKGQTLLGLASRGEVTWHERGRGRGTKASRRRGPGGRDASGPLEGASVTRPAIVGSRDALGPLSTSARGL